MAHETVPGGPSGPRSLKELAQIAGGRRCRATRWALAAAGLILVTAGLARSQVPVGSGDSDPPGIVSTSVPDEAPAPRLIPASTPVAAPTPGVILPADTVIAQQPAPMPAVVPNPPRPPDVAPMPRRAGDLFGGTHPRLEGLPAGVKAPVGTTPVPTKEVRDKFNKYIGYFIDPEDSLELVAGRPRLMYLKEAPFRIQIADERIMSWTAIGTRPNELSLLGLTPGTTVMNLWFGDREDLNKQTVLSFLVRVLPDPEAKERLERVYKALEEELNCAFPDAYICLFLVGDKLAVSGQVKDAVEATKILQIVRANAPASGGSPGAAAVPVNQVSLNLASPTIGLDNQAQQSLENYIVQGESNVINLLRIAGEQQVTLKVTVAEVSRAAARSIGLNWSIRNDHGIQVFAQQTGNLNNATGANGGSAVNLPVLLDQGQISIAIQALRSVNLARSLAEPNLTTLNGIPAYFQAGGEFPVPVVTGATATGLTGVSFVPFGVQLNFTPFVTDKDRIRLQLNATVSVRDVATGTNFGTGNTGNTFVPGLTTRTVTTTVEMREGQTLAIGGLLQTNFGANTIRVPGFGDIPFGGQLFRVDQTQASESELVLLVTPQLVHPMEPNEIPPLPGSDVFEPGDLEFYLHGRLESRRSYDYRSPVMSDLHRMAAYRHCELLYFVGPHGHSDGR